MCPLFPPTCLTGKYPSLPFLVSYVPDRYPTHPIMSSRALLPSTPLQSMPYAYVELPLVCDIRSTNKPKHKHGEGTPVRSVRRKRGGKNKTFDTAVFRETKYHQQNNIIEPTCVFGGTMLPRRRALPSHATTKNNDLYISSARTQGSASRVYPRSPHKSPDLSLRSNHAAILPAPLHRVQTSSPLLLQTGHGGGRPDVGWTMRSFPIWAAVTAAARMTTNTTGLALAIKKIHTWYNNKKTEQNKGHP